MWYNMDKIHIGGDVVLKRNIKQVIGMIIIVAVILAGCVPSGNIIDEESKAVESKDENNSKIIKDIEDYKKLGNTYTLEFYNGELEALYEKFSPNMKKALSVKKLKKFLKQVITTYGALKDIETEIIDDTSTPPYIAYVATVTLKEFDGELYVQFFMNNEGVIEGFYIKPKPIKAESKYLDYKTKSDLILPFEGEWYVIWGGRNIEENYHAAYPDQRFAMDVLIIKDGKSYKDDGKSNNDYYAFGKSVIAPANGIVVGVEYDIVDNVPGEMNSENTLGNYLILDHRNGEYSFIAHFKKGTIKVKLGDEVIQGQKLGECGNSGNSSEAHIHYHIQDTSVFSKGNGMPANFKRYLANNKEVNLGEPIRGEVIENN